MTTKLVNVILKAQGVPLLAEDDDVAIVDSNLTQPPTEYRADLVIAHRRGRRWTAGIIVEVQLRRDTRKQFSWPLYAAALRAQHECPTHVLVVTPHAGVAKWASEPVRMGLTADVVFKPLVCGPSVIPRITDRDTAQREPELTLLSVMAHGMGPNAIDVGKAGLVAAATQVDGEHGPMYSKLVLAAVPPAVRGMLEELMRNENWDWVPKNKFVDGLVDKGIAIGEAEGRAKALMVVLNARHVALTAEQRERIITCRDLRMLDDWIARAVVAASADDILR